MITVEQNFNLKDFNSFDIDSMAGSFVNFNFADDVKLIFDYCHDNHLAWYVLGGGSNTLFLEDFEGMIIHPTTHNITVMKEDADSVIINVDAGVVWDDFVAFCVDRGYGGIENLSGIPGTVGASPVQNIGAYGVEAKDVIRGVEYYNTQLRQSFFLDGADCAFGYRNSIFKNELKGCSLVLNVIFKLSKKPEYHLNYGDVAARIEQTHGTISLASIRKAILEIRAEKLPDPKITGNAGSFFKNPIVSNETALKLRSLYPTIPLYPAQPQGMKVSAAWLIEQAGWKGRSLGCVGVHDRQALVLVNRGGATGREVLDLAMRIIDDVNRQFDIQLSPEVNLVSNHVK